MEGGRKVCSSFVWIIRAEANRAWKLRFGPDKHGRRVSKESCRRCEINIWRCAENRILSFSARDFARSAGINRSREREREFCGFPRCLFSLFDNSVDNLPSFFSKIFLSFFFFSFSLSDSSNPISISLSNFNEKERRKQYFLMYRLIYRDYRFVE